MPAARTFFATFSQLPPVHARYHPWRRQSTVAGLKMTAIYDVMALRRAAMMVARMNTLVLLQFRLLSQGGVVCLRRQRIPFSIRHAIHCLRCMPICAILLL